MHIIVLEDPLGADAGTSLEAVIAGEVPGEFDFRTDVQVVAAEELANVVPDLRFGDEDELAVCALLVTGVVGQEEALVEVEDIFSPDIGKTAEAEAVYAEDVLHSPYEGELKGKAALGTVAEGLVEEFEVEGVGEIIAVQEVIDTEEEVLVYSHKAVILYLKAQGSKCGVAPEIEAAGNLHVAAAGSLVHTVIVLGVVIVVDEEEGVAPGVSVETLESGGEVTPVLTEVIEGLEVGLCKGSLSHCKCRCGDDDFFKHKA